MTDLKRTVHIEDFDDFPIDINKEVLEELNRFLTNSKWRSFARKSLNRYKNYKVVIDEKSQLYNLPKELAAVAFIESGFQNTPSRHTSISKYGAGMWQFIPNTAKKFGLHVSSESDERYHIPLATDAAMRYLRSNQLLLNDLRLALMSYYVGENRVLSDINQFDSRDPWTLIEKGNYQTPYLARVMAAAILIKYPNLLD